MKKMRKWRTRWRTADREVHRGDPRGTDERSNLMKTTSSRTIEGIGGGAQRSGSGEGGEVF